MGITNVFFILLLLVVLPLLFKANARSLSSASTADQFLAPHNSLRASLGLPPLRWDGKLTAYAELYGKQRKTDCALEHSTANYGENIFWGQGSRWKIADAVAAWAAERGDYNYNRNSCAANADCTHYTQMVWRNTQRLGCAKVICNSGDTFIVCEYDPHGNIIGAKPY